MDICCLTNATYNLLLSPVDFQDKEFSVIILCINLNHINPDRTLGFMRPLNIFAALDTSLYSFCCFNDLGSELRDFIIELIVFFPLLAQCFCNHIS